MMVEILEITVVRGRGPDYLYLQTRLPNGCWPFKGNTSLKLEVAKDLAEQYCEANFPGVPVEVITTHGGV
jgi:hypothetical protein